MLMKKYKIYLFISGLLLSIGVLGMWSMLTWITNDSYRATLHVLCPENANRDNLLRVIVFSIIIISGFVLGGYVIFKSSRNKALKWSKVSRHQ